MPRKKKSPSDPLNEFKEKLQAIENLLILQLIQGGATAKQIEKVLQIESFSQTNIP